MEGLSRAAQAVSRRTAIVRVDINDQVMALEVDLAFDPADPYAATVVFHTAAPVLWTFARDLLFDGRYEPVGEGDVRVWPDIDTNGTSVVVIELNGHEGTVMVQMDSRDLDLFTHDMGTSVPRGQEESQLDLDGALSAFLAPRAP